MAERNTDKTTKPEGGFRFGNIAAPDPRAITEMMKNAEAAFENSLQTFSNESVRFVKQRLERTGAALEEYRERKDMTGLLAAQQKWFAEMTRDYRDETVRLGDVARKLFADRIAASGTAAPKPKSEKP